MNDVLREFSGAFRPEHLLGNKYINSITCANSALVKLAAVCVIPQVFVCFQVCWLRMCSS
jgi:hypothetical protein